MKRNLFYLILGIFGGVWFVWPGIASKNGWQCARDIALNVERNQIDSNTFLEDINRKLKISSAISPKFLLKAEKLGQMDKIRILGDACFRN
tara:strand:+ start:232 stop:504 length:273 start_codon:yes stop_codon:yes gene_type:complete